MAINLTDLQTGNIEPRGKAKLTNSIILGLFRFSPNRMQINSFLSFQSLLIFYVMQYSCSFVTFGSTNTLYLLSFSYLNVKS